MRARGGGSNIEPRTYDVVVLGAGVIGLTIAWRVAERGHSVALVDPTPGKGASHVAAGMLAPVTEAEPGEESLLRLNLTAAEGYPRFIAEVEERSGQSTGFLRCGTLMIAPDADARELLDELYRWRVDLGVAASRLTPSECRTLEPALSPAVRGGVFAEGDHQVDNRALVAALEIASRAAGVRFIQDSFVSMETSGDRVVGAITAETGLLSAQDVVVALGAHSGSLSGLPPDAQVPVRPVKGQLVHLGRAGDAPLFSCNLRTPDAYLVARADGRIVVGATVEERGFDTAVTADAVRDLLDAAHEVLPSVLNARFVGAVAGLRPALPDNKPAIGRGSMSGLVWATGHYRNGILLAGVTADAIVELIETGREPQRFGPFSPARFTPSTIS